MLPLEGITVVSLEQAVAAPYATGKLAQAGARVIKVERPEGDFARGYDRLVHGQSAYFVWLNHGKQSVALDLRKTSDLDLMRRMIAKADIFVQNLESLFHVTAFGRKLRTFDHEFAFAFLLMPIK